MDRLFLDANVLFSAAYRTDGGLVRLWKLTNVVLCSSRYALGEARANLLDEAQHRRLAQLADGLQFFEAPEGLLPRGIALPEKDAPILLAAVAARAHYLLTGDLRHFGAYFGKRIEGVTIVSPAQYFRIRQREER